MWGHVLLVYAIGFVIMVPLSAYCWYRICKEEDLYEQLENADAGEMFEPEKKPNVLATMFLMIVAGILWPFFLVILPGMMLYTWITKKFPDLMGDMYRNDDEE